MATVSPCRPWPRRANGTRACSRSHFCRPRKSAAPTVDSEAGHRLGDTRYAVEDAREQADVGEGEPCFLAHDEQHRGERELVIVADAVGGADQAYDANIT